MAVLGYKKGGQMLKAKQTLKSRAKLTAKPITKRQKKPQVSKLKKNAWEYFSRYVRLRDCERIGNEWYGKCITCSKTGLVAYIDENNKLRFTRGWDAGHFIGRSNWYLRHAEENVNLQCSFRCNKMRGGEHELYKDNLDNKYGGGTYRNLEKLAKANREYAPTRAELEEILSDAKTSIAFLTMDDKINSGGIGD